MRESSCLQEYHFVNTMYITKRQKGGGKDENELMFINFLRQNIIVNKIMRRIVVLNRINSHGKPKSLDY